MINTVYTKRTTDWNIAAGLEGWCKSNGFKRTAWDGFSSIYTRVSNGLYEKVIIICIND